MKNTRSCPKCRSGDVVEIPGGHEGGVNWLPTGLRSTPIDRYVCCACGFCEEWIRADKLTKVQKFWRDR